MKQCVKNEAKDAELLDRAESDVDCRNGEQAGRGRLWWKDKVLGLGHVDHSSRNVKEAVRNAALDGRGKLRNGERSVIPVQVILKAMGFGEITSE